MASLVPGENTSQLAGSRLLTKCSHGGIKKGGQKERGKEREGEISGVSS